MFNNIGGESFFSTPGLKKLFCAAAQNGLMIYAHHLLLLLAYCSCVVGQWSGWFTLQPKVGRQPSLPGSSSPGGPRGGRAADGGWRATVRAQQSGVHVAAWRVGDFFYVSPFKVV